MAEQALKALTQRLAAAGIQLPRGVSAGNLVIGLLVAAFVASRFLSTVLLFLIGLVAYWGIATDGGSRTLKSANQKLSAILRRPVPSYTALCALCLVVAVLGYVILPGKAAATSTTTNTEGPSNSDLLLALRDAYDQGYNDGSAKEKRKPPKRAPAELINSIGSRKAAGSSSSSSMGMSQLMKYGAAGYFIYNLGKTPAGWNPQQAAQNAKANPLPLIFLLVMLSGVFF